MPKEKRTRMRHHAAAAGRTEASGAAEAEVKSAPASFAFSLDLADDAAASSASSLASSSSSLLAGAPVVPPAPAAGGAREFVASLGADQGAVKGKAAKRKLKHERFMKRLLLPGDKSKFQSSESSSSSPLLLKPRSSVPAALFSASAVAAATSSLPVPGAAAAGAGSLASLASLRESLPEAEQRVVKQAVTKAAVLHRTEKRKQNKAKKGMSAHQRRLIAAKEIAQFSAVLAHPTFQEDPAHAIREHLENTFEIGARDEAKAAREAKAIQREEKNIKALRADTAAHAAGRKSGIELGPAPSLSVPSGLAPLAWNRNSLDYLPGLQPPTAPAKAGAAKSAAAKRKERERKRNDHSMHS